MRTLLAVALLAALAPAAPVPKALKKKVDDTSAIVGTWRPAPGTRGESFRFTADGGMQAWTGGAGGGESFPYTWVIDPTTDPKRMTWGSSSNPTQVQFECVYELDGDRLRIAYNGVGKRPAKVDAGVNGVHFCDLVRDPAAK
jgi:uncharacterized protein (TIGR03067 family)